MSWTSCWYSKCKGEIKESFAFETMTSCVIRAKKTIDY